ncbi:MAG: phospholipid carrier-dependent glycosyltransferase [Bacteroidia bacterium]|nr:phospholipid carrier-dependent glycosyltransferase [Bacteroidia bacterium]
MPRSVAWPGRAAAAAGLALVAVWLWDVSGGSPPLWLARAVVIAASALAAVYLTGLATRLWRREQGQPVLTAGRLLLLLVLLSLAVRLIGIDFEISGRYYRDEGIYYEAAQRINEGKLLPESFIYGHLPYYLQAILLWIQSLFPQAISRFLQLLYEVGDEIDASWLLLRGLSAVFGALTTIPVFIVGQRIAGRLAATLGALLIIFSPIYNEITHLIISDVPSAFFATLTLMFVARLLDGENLRDYLWAGACAGLAAASKYPAGMVAVAIVAIWIYWRVRTRRFSWYLVWSGLVSVAALLVAMPAFWAHAGSAFAGQGKDLLFGVRQYAKGGWIGVKPQSNVLWYGRNLVQSFGWPAAALGLLGVISLARKERRRWLVMAAYPVAFLILMSSMSMVVKRNLLPAMPAIAALLGAGLAGWQWRLSAGRSGLARWWPVGVLSLASLAIPVYRTVLQEVSLVKPSTRELAAWWINTNLPRGAGIVQESYTPHIHYKRFQRANSRFAARFTLEQLREPQWDFVLLADSAYRRFLSSENWTKPHHEVYAERYRELLEFDLIQEWLPTPIRLGPRIGLYAIDSDPQVFLSQYRFELGDEPFRYPRDDAYLLLKQYFDAGSYRISLDTEPSEVGGRVRVVTRDGRVAGEFDILNGVGVAMLPWPAKYFLYVYLPEGTEISALAVEPAEAD